MMLECVICTKHPHEPGAECTPLCIEVPQSKGKTKVIHRHAHEVDCNTDCHTADADLGIICSPCAQRIRKDLDALVDTYTLSAKPPEATGHGERSASTHPLPGGTEWLDWRQGSDLFGVLTTWTRDWMETYALAGPRRGDLTSITGWLRAHLPHAANSHPAIDDFANEIRDLANRGRRIVGEVKDNGQRIPCSTDHCTRTVHVHTADLDQRVRCRSCGIERTAGQILLIASRSEAWVPIQTAADVTGRNPTTIRRWIRTGKLEHNNGRVWLPTARALARAA